MTSARKQRGSTLIELMIVVACLGILGGLLGATSGPRAAALGVEQQHLRATRALESELERVRAMGGAPRSGVFRNGEVDRLPRSTAYRAVTPASPGLARIELRLEWHDALEQRQRLRLVTLVRTAAAAPGAATPREAPR